MKGASPPGAGGAAPRNAPRSGPPAEPLSPRGAAFAGFAVAAVAGYALLRLAAAPGEPDPRTLGPSVHVAYYWRVATALWWGCLAGIGAWRVPRGGELAAHALPWVVAGATIAAFALP